MDIPRFISTADVPPKYLKSAMLVGRIPFKALHTDPRVSYTFYIPPEHLNPDPTLQNQNHDELDPIYELPPLPLIVTIHGTGRNAEVCRDRLIDFAHSERVAILAPLFPAGIESYNDLDNYKLLKYKTMRADLMLLQILDEVALRWPGIDTEKVFMMGFSGGGQFAHRFMYLHADRLRAVSIGAPGMVTMLDERLKWPNGVKDLAEVFGEGTVVRKETIKKLPIQLVVGGEDNVVHGGDEFWEWLQEKKKKLARDEGSSNAEKGEAGRLRLGRVDTLKALQDAWKDEGIASNLEIVAGVRHDSGGVLDVVKAFLGPYIRIVAR
ncbi:alpha/beta-hydrolase [Stipitochalara longipes BDJ]|nr:alpha/beta-hydrolase [Stipitochalara longipes BDJ]